MTEEEKNVEELEWKENPLQMLLRLCKAGEPDSTDRFDVDKNGEIDKHSCVWAKTKATRQRCLHQEVLLNCPVTCGM